MKIVIYILFLCFGFNFQESVATNYTNRSNKLIWDCFGVGGTLDVSDDIASAIKQGKASELVKFFDEKISIKIINQEDVLSKSQAEANLKYFFEKHPVKNFTESHVSSMNNNMQYITGSLETGNGKFRVSILIRRNLISQFRIENDND